MGRRKIKEEDKAWNRSKQVIIHFNTLEELLKVSAEKTPNRQILELIDKVKVKEEIKTEFLTKLLIRSERLLRKDFEDEEKIKMILEEDKKTFKYYLDRI